MEGFNYRLSPSKSSKYIFAEESKQTGLDTTKPVNGVFDKARFKLVSSASEIRLKNEISSVAIKFRYATIK